MPRVSLGTQTIKGMPAMWETQVQSLDWEDPLEKGMASCCSILAWRIPWTEEPGGLQSMGLRWVGCDQATNTYTWQVLIYSWHSIPTSLFTERWNRLWGPRAQSCAAPVGVEMGLSDSWVPPPTHTHAHTNAYQLLCGPELFSFSYIMHAC